MILKCKNCNTNLAEIIINESNEQRMELGLRPIFSKYKIKNCNKCGAESFNSQIIEGSAFVGPLRKEFITTLENTEVIDDNNRQIVFMTLSLKNSR